MRLLILICLSWALINLISCDSTPNKSPQELRMELRNQEALNFSSYLKLTSSLKPNQVLVKTRLFGADEYDQRGFVFSYSIRNTASVAIYKDVQVVVELVSKTQSVIDKIVLTKYEFFQPGQELSFNDVINPNHEKDLASFNAYVLGAKTKE